jgi:nuclear transcription Y subunit beta
MSDDKIQNTPTKTNNGDVVQDTQTSQGDEMPMQEFRAQDFFLPSLIFILLFDFNSILVANIARIMKRALPQNAKVSKSAKECCQECVTEFVLFVTSE